jgi:hypothetical protein
MTTETNAQRSKRYLDGLSPEARQNILGQIARHYGIEAADAYEEVTTEPAEMLADYIPGPLAFPVYHAVAALPPA